MEKLWGKKKLWHRALHQSAGGAKADADHWRRLMKGLGGRYSVRVHEREVRAGGFRWRVWAVVAWELS